MLTRDYLVTYENEDTVKYFVTLYEVPWHVDMRYRLFKRLDPCSRKPHYLWAWSGLIAAEIRSYVRYDEYEIDRTEVSKDWARTHFENVLISTGASMRRVPSNDV